MKRTSLLKALEKYPVFTVKAVAGIIGKESSYAKLVIHRLKREKLVLQIERNKYTTQSDPLVIASNIIWPCYLSGWSALRFYNLTEQLPQVISVITTRRRKKKELHLNRVRILFTRTKPEYLFGYRRESHQGLPIFMAEKEKALLDSAVFRMISFSEICSIVRENRDSIDGSLLVKYLIRTGNKAVMKRFGFLLDSLGMDVHSLLERHINGGYVPLDYALPAEGVRNKKWRVIENAEP